MNPRDRTILGSTVLMALATQGCGTEQDRQVVFTAPRSQAARVEVKNQARSAPPGSRRRGQAPGLSLVERG